MTEFEQRKLELDEERNSILRKFTSRMGWALVWLAMAGLGLTNLSAINDSVKDVAAAIRSTR